MEFFITIPWLIAWAENGFAIVSRDETLDWTPVELERLAKFLPDEVARGAIARGNHNFVAFRFRRFPIDHDSPYNRFDAVHTLAHDSMFPAAAIAFADDPIHHRRYTGRRESYETIVRAATCLINDGSGNPLKGLQDAFDHCRGPYQFGDTVAVYATWKGTQDGPLPPWDAPAGNHHRRRPGDDRRPDHGHPEP